MLDWEHLEVSFMLLFRANGTYGLEDYDDIHVHHEFVKV